MSENTVSALQLMLTPGIGGKTLSRILGGVGGSGPLADVMRSNLSDLVSRFRVRPASAEAIPGKEAEAKALEEELNARQVETLLLGDDAYPARLRAVLGDEAPPVLFVQGKVDLLESPGIAFSGSRKASARGLEVARDCARVLAEHSVNVVSGNARGVDLAAHREALVAGGSTTMVVAEGILQYKPRNELREFLTGDNHVVVSEFPPYARWHGRMAMQRNKTICASADAVLIIESGLSGGTYAAGQMASSLGRPLFVVDYEAPPPSAEGNAYFLARGAQPLRRGREGRPNVERLLAVVGTSPEPDGQQTLSFG